MSCWTTCEPNGTGWRRGVDAVLDPGRALDVLEGVCGCGGASGSSLANSTGVAGADTTGEGSRRVARAAGTAADSAGDGRCDGTCCCGCLRLAAVSTGLGDILGKAVAAWRVLARSLCVLAAVGGADGNS